MTKPKPRAKRKPTNYASRSSAKTLEKQAQIHRWIRVADEGFSITELAALLGISRQLCLYHVKKMAATGQLVMMLEPCSENGGLQFRVWDQIQLVTNYIPNLVSYREAA